jgi:N-sulfoglucosamine sulfohydrolase
MVVHVLQIVSHDTGNPAAYLTLEEMQRYMPHWMKFLKEDAVCFSNCHDATPECSAARAALATGQEPHEEGCEVLGLTHAPFGHELANREHHIARWLKLKAGYVSVHSGVEHVTNDISKGKASTLYDQHIITPNNYADTIIPPVLERMAALAAEGKAVYAQIDFEETHREFRPELKALLPEGPLPSVPSDLPNTEEVREDWTCFIAEIVKLDQAYGRIFAALKAKNLFSNTLIVTTSDHGIAYPGYKCNLTTGGTEVYMAMSGPGFSEYHGKEVNALVSHTDVFATICVAVGVDIPAWTRGEAWQPLLSGAKKAVHEATFHELTYHVAEDVLRAVRTDDWLYIERVGPSTRPPANIDDGAAKDILLKDPAYLNVAQYQLFELHKDPRAQVNLADDFPDTVKKFKALLRQHMQETNDQLLHSYPVPLKDGRTAFPHDTLSPPEEIKIRKKRAAGESIPEDANRYDMPDHVIYKL